MLARFSKLLNLCMKLSFGAKNVLRICFQFFERLSLCGAVVRKVYPAKPRQKWDFSSPTPRSEIFILQIWPFYNGQVGQVGRRFKRSKMSERSNMSQSILIAQRIQMVQLNIESNPESSSCAAGDGVGAAAGDGGQRRKLRLIILNCRRGWSGVG